MRGMDIILIIPTFCFGLAVGLGLAFTLRGKRSNGDDQAQMLALMDAMRNEQNQLAGRLGALAENQQRTHWWVTVLHRLSGFDAIPFGWCSHRVRQGH